MKNELVKRLRGLRVDGTPADVTMGQAADEIERLRALVGRMLPYVQRWESADAAELEAQASIEDEAERVLYATHEPCEQPVATPGALPTGEDSVFHSAESSRPRELLSQGATPDASPADLVGALQDVVHTDPGPVRAAYAVRCTCFEDGHGEDCDLASGGCCGQCIGKRTFE